MPLGARGRHGASEFQRFTLTLVSAVQSGQGPQTRRRALEPKEGRNLGQRYSKQEATRAGADLDL